MQKSYTTQNSIITCLWVSLKYFCISSSNNFFLCKKRLRNRIRYAANTGTQQNKLAMAKSPPAMSSLLVSAVARNIHHPEELFFGDSSSARTCDARQPLNWPIRYKNIVGTKEVCVKKCDDNVGDDVLRGRVKQVPKKSV